MSTINVTNPSDASAAFLRDFYTRRGVESASAPLKLVEIKREIGDKLFAAYGGDETLEMELAALEYELLMQEGIESPVEC